MRLHHLTAVIIILLAVSFLPTTSVPVIESDFKEIVEIEINNGGSDLTEVSGIGIAIIILRLIQTCIVI